MTARVLDLFCGAGGFSTGFERAGFETVAGIDANDAALETYKANRDAPGLNIDLAETEPDDLLDQIGVDADDIDVITGGPPCQSFSPAGKRDPDDPRGRLVENYYDVIDHVRPEVFVMENVRGLQSMNDGEVIDYIVERVDELGYELIFDVLDAADFGVPQTRNRLILIGSRVGMPILPTPTHEDGHVGVEEVVDCPAGLQTSAASYAKQLRGETPFRTTEEPAYTVTSGLWASILPATFEPVDNPGSITDYRIDQFDTEQGAHIQSFPEGYSFKGNLTQQRKQIANAVPPLLAEKIARTVDDVMTGAVEVDVQTDLLAHGFALAD